MNISTAIHLLYTQQKMKKKKKKESAIPRIVCQYRQAEKSCQKMLWRIPLRGALFNIAMVNGSNCILISRCPCICPSRWLPSPKMVAVNNAPSIDTMCGTSALLRLGYKINEVY